MKKKLVIIGAGDFQNPLILKAKEFGYETHVFAWKDGSIGEKTADFFYPISIVEKEKILIYCQNIKPDGVCTIASDLATITVNFICENLKLSGNSTKCTKLTTNKYLMREALKENNINVPEYCQVKNNYKIDNLKSIKFPSIVKPTDRSGSRAITLVNNISELQIALDKAIEVSFNKEAIVEDVISGQEYSCECITQNGIHYFIALTQKYTTGGPNFIENGHLQPAQISEKILANVKETVFSALTALNITNSASHSEFRIDEEENIGIIEIGARMGGDCIGSKLVELSTGYDFVKMVIDVSCGKKLDFHINKHYKHSAIKFVVNDNDVNTLNNIKKNKIDLIYMISDINFNFLNNADNSSNRAGYYILTAENENNLINILQEDNNY